MCFVYILVCSDGSYYFGHTHHVARRLEAHAAGIAAVFTREPRPVRWKKEYTRRTEWFLEHHLMVSNFRCVLDLALRETPDTEVVTWKQGKEIWFRVMIPGERKQVVRVAPDACFALRQGDRVRHFFLEADRSTEERRRLVNKFVGYWWHLQALPFADLGGGRPRISVLFVTTGQRRMAGLLNLFRRVRRPNRASHGGRGLYWVALEPNYSVGNPESILGRIWRSPANSHDGLSLRDVGCELTPPARRGNVEALPTGRAPAINHHCEMPAT